MIALAAVAPGCGPDPEPEGPAQRDIPADLLAWREVRRIDTGLARAGDLAVADGVAYVAGEGVVRALDMTGPAARRRDIAVGDEPVALAVAGDALYVALARRIERRRLPDGVLQDRWETLPAGVVITDLDARTGAVAVAGWNAATREGMVLWYDASGREQGRRGGFTVPSGYFTVAWAPADGSEGAWLRVAHCGTRQVEAYDDARRLRFAWGESSVSVDDFCGCCNPVDLAVLHEGMPGDAFGIVTSEKGLPTVKVYYADVGPDAGERRGTVESVIAGPDAFVEQRNAARRGRTDRIGLEVAAGAGRVYVLDRATGVLRIYERKTDTASQ
ncbi:MAG: hypothetical protein KGY99_08005 [Phycisphaerae bacterium]|nr:hypothetical protein [Phycisphaerae bacterium]